MRYWLDTEFIEDGKTIDLISIGIVAEDGREFYGISLDCDHSKASEWVRDNVIAHLPTVKDLNNRWMTRDFMQQSIIDFCDPFYGKPEFWAYYADYDWVVFAQVFGTMMDLPKGFPMYCRDIKQECDRLGNPELPEQGKGEHNALEDARWNKKAWEFLKVYEQTADTLSEFRQILTQRREKIKSEYNALWEACKASPKGLDVLNESSRQLTHLERMRQEYDCLIALSDPAFTPNRSA